QKLSLSGGISVTSISESGRVASRASLRLRADVIGLSSSVLRTSVLIILSFLPGGSARRNESDHFASVRAGIKRQRFRRRCSRQPEASGRGDQQLAGTRYSDPFSPIPHSPHSALCSHFVEKLLYFRKHRSEIAHEPAFFRQGSKRDLPIRWRW